MSILQSNFKEVLKSASNYIRTNVSDSLVHIDKSIRPTLNNVIAKLESATLAEVIASLSLIGGSFYILKTINNNTDTTLHLAVLHRDIRAIKELIKRGVNVNAENKLGQTPLHLAAFNGHRKAIEVLISGNAVIDAKDKDGYTPLHYAANKGQQKAIKALIKSGADVNAKDKDGQTPLHYTARNGHTEGIDLLIKGKAEVNAKDEDNKTPLHLAAQNGFTGAIDLLIDAKADVNAQDKDGYTPFHYAANNGQQKVIERLIKHGAKANNDENNNERKPIDLHSLNKKALIEEFTKEVLTKFEPVLTATASKAFFNLNNLYEHPQDNNLIGAESKLTEAMCG